MTGFLLRALAAAFGLWVASKLVAGLDFDSWTALAIAALVLGLVNAVVRPILMILSIPLLIVTLGLFLLVINALLLGLVGMIVPGFHLHGAGPAFWGALVVSLASWAASLVLRPDRDRR